MNNELINKLLSKQVTHNFIHHIGEEELISCKVKHIEFKDGHIHLTCDCNDKPREPGHQEDLSTKMNERMKKMKLPGLPRLPVKVIHSDSEAPFNNQ